MLAKLANAVQRAQRDGYAGLWASGDMFWEFDIERNFSRLLAYEVELKVLLEENPGLSGICQYHRDSIPATAVQVVLYTHQPVFGKSDAVPAKSALSPTCDAPGDCRPGATEEMIAQLE